MRSVVAIAVAGLGGVVLTGCTPDWAKQNETGFVFEISGIAPAGGAVGAAIISDVVTDEGSIFNDLADVSVNAFRKNNNVDLGVSPVEHIYLERYDVRYFRTDGRDVEGVDVPYRISGPLGNVRLHTPGPGGEGEVEATIPITIVRHQAKAEPPLRNLAGFAPIPYPNPTGEGIGGALILTTIAEVTVHARVATGGNLVAVGRAEVSFANFADQ